jgi:hypothetical protein
MASSGSEYVEEVNMAYHKYSNLIPSLHYVFLMLDWQIEFEGAIQDSDIPFPEIFLSMSPWFNILLRQSP